MSKNHKLLSLILILTLMLGILVLAAGCVFYLHTL